MTPEAGTDRPVGAGSDAEDSICLDCGMCCDGTLYGNARVRREDEDTVAALGLKVVEEEGRRVFRQPCPHFGCGQCRVYEMRPPVCRRFRCSLLKSVDDGRETAFEARNKIARAKTLIASVRKVRAEAITPAQRVNLADDLRSELVTCAELEKVEIGRALLDIVALELYLTRWFHKRKSEAKTDR